MLNREIYLKDPSTRKLINEGVANVNDDLSREALAVLRYELETFVCHGQYQKGLEHILETYLKNLESPQQPGVWVSGFYGSGKSHLVKMLRALWVNTPFEDGATARGIAVLPQILQDLLKELDTQGKRHGGLHAASGTLGSGASGSVRLALLRIVFKSAGLPEQYQKARFVMWLKNEGIYDQVRELVENHEYDWQDELDNFYVAEGLHEALVQVKPNLFSSSTLCVETLNNLFPFVQDISSEEMVKAIRLALTRDGKFPLTLIILDEVQVYIGEDNHRSNQVQEVVETCCKNFSGKLLFIGTGQTAVTGTSSLKKLEGRFTIRVELSDADVETVIRQVILAKKPSAIGAIEQTMQTNLGEISRHLSSTNIGHRQEDIQFFAQDYPILPIRRRFWENTLRVLDRTGTESQLRNQLSMVHKVIQTNLDQTLSHVVPTDFLFFDSADKLLQTHILSRKVYEKTMKWYKGTPEEHLMARACGLVFLIDKLSRNNEEIGIRPTVDTIADLMIEDLSSGSSALRSQLPQILDKCDLVMRVRDEYRIQTEESAAWNDDFLEQRHRLANDFTLIEIDRNNRIREFCNQMMKKLSVLQGKSRVPREFPLVFNGQLPLDHQKKIYIWIRDGWSIDENSVQIDARQAGNQSPTIFVYIPKPTADELRYFLLEYRAAVGTLEKKGVPNTPEGKEARAAVETICQTAQGKINALLEEAFHKASVFQGGGSEILEIDLPTKIQEATQNALQRLYPQFQVADHPGWGKVYEKAREGAPDALKTIDYAGEVPDHPVGKSILGFIASGKQGADIRDYFEAPPYGWPRDAIDGGLQVLLNAGLIHAQDNYGKTLDPKGLERKQIGKIAFKVESTTVSATQRIEIRKLLILMHCQFTPNNELTVIPDFLQKLDQLAHRAGGEAPQPLPPDLSIINDIRLSSGNEQLIAIYNQRDYLKQSVERWSDLAVQIEKRWPIWLSLQTLLHHAGTLKAAQEMTHQAETIKNQRLLLHDPDLLHPLLQSLEDLLRKELGRLQQCYLEKLNKLRQPLNQDNSWLKLSEDEQNQILGECSISEIPPLKLGTLEELIDSLKRYPLPIWSDRTDALSMRFSRAREMAAQEIEPQTQTVDLPRRTLTTEAEVRQWLSELEVLLLKSIQNGPIIPR